LWEDPLIAARGARYPAYTESALLISATLIFVAELGDKSQLKAFTFATRYRFWLTMLGTLLATLIVHPGSVVIGRIAAGLAYPLLS
jgi:putative Ca2+/H+ antiporter (TMEM165/GDT1 family)